MIMLEYQNIKIFLEKGSEEVFMIKKLKKFCIGHMLLVVGADSVGSFCKKKKKKKKLKKTNQKELRVERLIKKKKATNHMSNCKATIVFLIVGFIKKDLI